MNIKLKYPIGAVLIILGVATCNYYYQKKNQQRVILDDKAVPHDNAKPSVWIDSWYPKDSSRGGKSYNNLIKLNDNQYLFVGKDGFGNTFDSTIITINK